MLIKFLLILVILAIPYSYLIDSDIQERRVHVVFCVLNFLAGIAIAFVLLA